MEYIIYKYVHNLKLHKILHEMKDNKKYKCMKNLTKTHHDTIDIRLKRNKYYYYYDIRIMSGKELVSIQKYHLNVV